MVLTSSIACEKVEFPSSSGNVIHGDLRFQNRVEGKPIVIVCHSFMAFKDWGFFPFIGENLAKVGYLSLTFNFSHNGVANNDLRITDLERFERNTFSKELDDLRSVVDKVFKGELIVRASNRKKYYIDSNKIALFGHSRGGGIAIIHAASDKRVNALVTMSAIAAFDRWTVHQKENWRRDGYLPLARDTSKSPLRLGINLLNDLDLHCERLDLVRAAAEIRVPWLIVHGDADVTVSTREAKELYAAADKSTTQLLLWEKVGHLYNAESPEIDNYGTLKKVLETIIFWLNKIYMRNSS